MPGQGWITAFETGLIVCPPRLRGVLHERLSLVMMDWFSWPLSWALDLFLVADDINAAFAEERFPKEIVRQLQEWQRAPRGSTKSGMTQTPSGPGPTYTLGWYAPEAEYAIKDAKHAEEILRLLSGKLVRVELETSWSDKMKIGVPYEFKPEYAMIGLNTKDGGSSANYKEIRKVSALRFAGHPEDAIGGVDAAIATRQASGARQPHLGQG